MEFVFWIIFLRSCDNILCGQVDKGRTAGMVRLDIGGICCVPCVCTFCAIGKRYVATYIYIYIDYVLVWNMVIV